MVVLLTCNNEEDPIKNKCARVLTRLYIDFSHTQGQLTPHSMVKSCRNSNSLIVLVTCKNEEYSIKNEGARVLT